MKFPDHKCALFLTHNEYKSYYETIEDVLEQQEFSGVNDWVSEEQRQKFKETGEIWVLQWYPDTPIGSCIAIASDLDALLEAVNK